MKRVGRGGETGFDLGGKELSGRGSNWKLRQVGEGGKALLNSRVP
jgi:hypothetical protein